MKVLKIELLESLNDQTDVLKVGFDDDSEALMFYKYGDSLKFVNQEVIVDFRSEYYHGRVWDAVNTLVEATKIHTVDAEADVKLFAKEVDDYSNVVFADLEDGDNSLGSIMFCTDQRREASDKARWISLTVRDKNMKYATLRIFNYDTNAANLVGQYIMCDISKSAYGLSTKSITKCDFVAKDSEDVVLSEQYVARSISDCEDLVTFNDKYSYINSMKNYVETFKGAPLIRLAMELSQLQCYKNCLSDVNFSLLKHAIVMSYGYTLTKNSALSRKVTNIIKTMNPVLEHYNKIAVILDDDETNDELKKEKIIYRAIKTCGDDLMKVRYMYV